jgi:hypothetical protein
LRGVEQFDESAGDGFVGNGIDDNAAEVEVVRLAVNVAGGTGIRAR